MALTDDEKKAQLKRLIDQSGLPKKDHDGLIGTLKGFNNYESFLQRLELLRRNNPVYAHLNKIFYEQAQAINSL